MNDENIKKTNWAVIISVLLAILLAAQTAAFFYYFKQQKKESVKESAADENFSASSYRNYSQRPASLLSGNTRHAYRNADDIFAEMQENMNQMMGGFFASLPGMMHQMNQHIGIESMPLVDLEEREKDYVVQIDMPGLDKNKIEITVRGEILTVQGVRETVNEEQSGSFYTQERSYGSFSRSLRLPGPVDEANIKAEYKNGVLTVTLPKLAAEEASKKITIS